MQGSTYQRYMREAATWRQRAAQHPEVKDGCIRKAERLERKANGQVEL